jgi:hypothetical protein
MSRQTKTITRASRARNARFVFDTYIVSFSDKIAQQYKPLSMNTNATADLLKASIIE